MADTLNFGWTKPTVGGDSGAWGTILNTALDDIDADLEVIDDAQDADAAAIAAMDVVVDKLVVGQSLADVQVVPTGSVLTWAAAIDLGLSTQVYTVDAFGPSGGAAAAVLTLTFSNRPVADSKVVHISVNTSNSNRIRVAVTAAQNGWALLPPGVEHTEHSTDGFECATRVSIPVVILGS